MASAVLGKRTRASEDVPALSTRSKRRAAQATVNDENVNPVKEHCGEEEAVGEFEHAVVEGVKKRSTIRTVPAKHGAPERRVSISPAKINAHFKTSKIEVYHDGQSTRVHTPSTPRHRDALSKKIPVTPQHRVNLNDLSRTPKTTPSSSRYSVYNQARKLFARCARPERLVGRETERQELSTFFQNCVESTSAGCLYVSGPPGTGKSALINELLADSEQLGDVRRSIVNCMSVWSTADLSQKLAEDLGLSNGAGFGYLRSCFVPEKTKSDDNRKYLVVLDEVDRLVDLNLEILYALFEWSLQADSRLILIGIANALDLTDRFLPRLKSRQLTPELLPFMPYSAAQIAEVLTSKAKSLCTSEAQGIPFLHPAAIQFCAKKVAAQTGDLRKAFDICRRAIDIVEQETRETVAANEENACRNSPSKTPLVENMNLSSPPNIVQSPSKTNRNMTAPSTITPAFTILTAPKATIAHMAKATAQAFSNGTTQRLNTLNLQQKTVLCALAAWEERHRQTTTRPPLARTVFATPSKSSSSHSSAPSVRHLFETYRRLCARETLPLQPLAAVEFRDVVSGLEALSLVVPASESSGYGLNGRPVTPSSSASGRRKKRAGGGGGGAVGFDTPVSGDERRVASAVGFKELSAAISGAPGGELLAEILEGGALEG